MATFFIMCIFRITGVGTVIAGKVESGMLRKGMRLNISGKLIQATGIEAHHHQIEQANPGDNVGITVRLIKDANYVDERSLWQKLSGISEEKKLLTPYVEKRVEFL